MPIETASIFAAQMIETLLNVHALTNMHRASENEEFRKGAAEWLPTLERQLSSLRRELAGKAPATKQRETGTEAQVAAVEAVLWSGLDLNGHSPDGVRRVARTALEAASVSEAKPVALLREVRERGLIYWEPNTERGHMTKADMLARIDAFLASHSKGE